jgi:hypothetical protein
METSTKILKASPYIILGAVIFAMNSNSEMNFFWKGNLILLEAKVGIIVLFFILTKIYKSRKNY